MINIGYEILSWLGLALVLLTLPGTLELAILTVAALLATQRVPTRTTGASPARLAVIIPAHNEEISLPRTIQSLLACEDPLPASDLIVAACNCTDRTVQVATALGCTVIERIDSARRGKGYGLDNAFRVLSGSGYDAYLIIDADTVVAKNFLTEFRKLFSSGADAGQCVLRVGNPDVNARTRLMNIAHLAHTYLRPLGRQYLGLSAGIVGNGFGLRADTVQRVPYQCFSIAEDLEYHVCLVRAGLKVEFVPTTFVRADACTSGEQARPQRERWEGGRLRIMREQVPGLIADVFLRRRLALIEPLLELLLLPLAYHVLLLMLLMVLGHGWMIAYAFAALLIVAGHVVAAMRLGQVDRDHWWAILGIPLFMAWKLSGIGGIVRASSKHMPWKRTAREGT